MATRLTYADIYLPFNGCLMERGEVPVVPGVGVSPMRQQERHHLSMAERGGIVEGNQPTWTVMERGGVISQDLATMRQSCTEDSGMPENYIQAV